MNKIDVYARLVRAYAQREHDRVLCAAMGRYLADVALIGVCFHGDPDKRSWDDKPAKLSNEEEKR